MKILKISRHNPVLARDSRVWVWREEDYWTNYHDTCGDPSLRSGQYQETVLCPLLLGLTTLSRAACGPPGEDWTRMWWRRLRSAPSSLKIAAWSALSHSWTTRRHSRGDGADCPVLQVQSVHFAWNCKLWSFFPTNIQIFSLIKKKYDDYMWNVRIFFT